MRFMTGNCIVIDGGKILWSNRKQLLHAL
jgi:hypothetical protein